MVARSIRFLITAGVLTAAFVGCGAKNKTAGSAVRPGEVKAGEALGKDGKSVGSADTNCSPSDDDAPLIIDLEGKDRKTLEQMFKKGLVPVVSYDCKSIKILEKCQFEAKFEYMGASVRKNVRSIENTDTLSAEVPLGGAGGIKGRVAAGQKVDIALAEVGTRAPVTLSIVAKPELKEVSAGDCNAASHFVYSIDIGAFAIAQRTSGEAAAAAQIFTASASGESKSNVGSQASEGKLDACEQAKDDDKEAPDGCRVPLRIHLRKLAVDAKEKENKEAAQKEAETKVNESGSPSAPKMQDAPCPNGTVRSEGGSCVPPSDKIKYLCRAPDVEECKTQCGKGHLGSCERLGMLLLWPPYKDGKPGERDPKGAIEALQKACDTTKKDGETKGCSTLANAYRATLYAPGAPPPSDAEKKTAYDKAGAVLDYACKRLDKTACSSLGFHHEYGMPPTIQGDVDKGVYFYKRACSMGNEFSCLTAARLYMDGKKAPDGKELFKREPEQALGLLDKMCKESSSVACGQLATYLTTDKYKVKDVKRAAGVFQVLCERKNLTGCAEQALLQISGDAGGKDPKAARSTLEQLCFDTNVGAACYGVALLKETGQGGTPEDKSKALDYYKKYYYIKDASARAAKLLEKGAKGVDKNEAEAGNFYRQACASFNNSDPALCAKAATYAEKQTPGSGRYYSSIGCRLGDKAACAKEKSAAAAAAKEAPGKPGNLLSAGTGGTKPAAGKPPKK
jgi:uncharacterized protein